MRSAITYHIPNDVCFSSNSDGVVVLNIKTGKLYSFIGASSDLWLVICEGAGQTAESIKTIASTRAIKAEVVEGFLSKTNSLGLLARSDANSKAFGWIRTETCKVLVFASRAILGLAGWLKAPRLAAFCLLTVFHLAGRLGGFQSRASLVKQWPISRIRSVEADMTTLSSAVVTACSWYPRESRCLQRASALSCLLRHHGFPALMKIGIRKQPFYAHAWVEVGGSVVGDHIGVQKYFENVATW